MRVLHAFACRRREGEARPRNTEAVELGRFRAPVWAFGTADGGRSSCTASVSAATSSIMILGAFGLVATLVLAAASAGCAARMKNGSLSAAASHTRGRCASAVAEASAGSSSSLKSSSFLRK